MKQKYKLLIAILLCVTVQTKNVLAQYAPNSWVAVNSGSSALMFGASFTIGTTIYVGTGLTSNGSSYTTNFWGYNTITDTWTSLASFPGAARCDAVGFAINGTGYMGLGDNSSGTNNLFDMYEYNPTTNTWSAVASVPSAAAGTQNPVSFVINGKGYICMGHTLSSNYNYLYQYDPLTNTWAAMASFPSAWSEAVGFSIGNLGYVGTGTTGTTGENGFYSYDPATNLWSSRAPMPGSGTWAGVAFSLCEYGYAGLGTAGNDFYQYDPSSNTWATMDAYPGSSGVFAGYVSAGIDDPDHTAFGFVGFGESGSSTALQNFYKYSPPVQCTYTTAINNDINSDTELQVSPNPATDFLNIYSPSDKITYQLYDVLGKVISYSKSPKNKYEVNTVNFNSGLYFLKVTYTSGESEVKKIIKM